MLGKVALEKFDPCYEIDWQNIASDDPPLVSNEIGGNLRPPSWRRTKIDNRHSTFDKLIFILYFQQLVARSRAQAVFLAFAHVFVVEVLFKPLLTGLRLCHR